MTDTPRPGGQKIRLLVAEDEKVFRGTLVELLAEEPDIEIVGEAADGQAAVDLAERMQADVVLMDIGMPRLDGIEATRELATRRPSAKVVILTIYSDDDRVFRALLAGAKGYLLKDASPEERLQAIRDVHRGEAVLHRALVQRVIREFTRLSAQHTQQEARFAELTPREQDVLELLAEGLRNQDIAARLAITEKTVKHHVSSILSKLQVNHRVEAALLASRAGLGRRPGVRDRWRRRSGAQ